MRLFLRLGRHLLKARKPGIIAFVVLLIIVTLANIIFGMILGVETARYVYLLLVVYWILIEIGDSMMLPN